MRIRSLPITLVTLAALVAGCGASRDATEKELAELRAEITKLRAAESALTGRVDQLEIDRGSFAKGAAAADAPKTDRPDLNVVRLSPQEGDGDADTGGPRPVIRATGNEGSINNKKSDKAGRAGSKKPSNNAPQTKP